jgi:hypothetical protein
VKLHKLTHAPEESTGEAEDGNPVIWPNRYRVEQTSGADRLVIAAREEPLDVLCGLAEAIGPECAVLYVHVVARAGAPRGRFQSPPLQLVDVRAFVSEYSALLENDARQEFWIGSPEDRGVLVYDRHGLIYAYGPLDEFERLLSAMGFLPGEFSLDFPHCHHYHAEYDADADRLLSHWHWRQTELHPEDEG